MKYILYIGLLMTQLHSIDYSNDIQPIFTSRCVSCHGYSGGLNLTSYENLMVFNG